MATIKIGYRRLFEAVECSVADQEQIRIEKKLPNGLYYHLYLGSEPIFGTTISSGRAKYITRNPMPFQIKPYEPLSNLPKGFYMEVICCEELIIPDDEYEKIKNGDNTLK